MQSKIRSLIYRKVKKQKANVTFTDHHRSTRSTIVGISVTCIVYKKIDFKSITNFLKLTGVEYIIGSAKYI